jgi:hypothetical protein
VNEPQAAISLRTFLAISIAAYALFGIPVVALLVGFGFLSVNAGTWIAVGIGLPGIAASAGFSWLLGKSRPPSDPPIGLVAACAVPARLYLLFGGGVVGGVLLGPIGGTIAAVVMFLLGMVLGEALARFVWSRLRWSG